jgi:FAD-dependent urate hydroxylase
MSSQAILRDSVEMNKKSTAANTADCEVVIIGAGPYGLSSAAHLKAKGLAVRVFGRPMEFWADKMPQGMLLRSPRPASTISDPTNACTLEAYEAATNTAPEVRVPLSTFVNYGQWFQRQLASDLDHREVASIETVDDGFQTLLQDGSSIRSERVVVAAGIAPFQRIPQIFKPFTTDMVSHCYSGVNVAGFSGKKVAIIGAGQSALECAALLHEAGAEVDIISRNPELRWIGMHKWLHQLGPISSTLYSKHDVGPIGISRLVAMPNLLKRLPLSLRDKIRTRAVRSAGSNWLPARLTNVTKRIGRSVAEAKQVGSRMELKLDDGAVCSVDHVLLGTGYSVDLSRYPFLPKQTLNQVRMLDGYPLLTSGFRSSVPGLHFVGATAARSFGPLVYFVTGTEFSSRALTSHIMRNRTVRR